MKQAIMALILLLGMLSPTAARAQDLGALAPPERQAMNDTLQQALENNPSDQPAEWVNPDTGRSGGVVPVRTYENAQGQPCREFVTTILIGGQQQQGYGRACRQPDGTWQIVDDTPPSEPPPAVANYFTTLPPRYYVYPSGFYYPYTIYLSFGTVYRHRHYYHGSFFLDGRHFRTRYPHFFRPWIYTPRRLDERYRRPRYRDDWSRERRFDRGQDRRERDYDRRRDRRRDRDHW